MNDKNRKATQQNVYEKLNKRRIIQLHCLKMKLLKIYYVTKAMIVMGNYMMKDS